MAAKTAGNFGAAVATYPAADYAGMRTFTTPDGKAGVSVKSDGDIVSVFKHPDSSASRFADSALAMAVQAGGNKLDAFDTVLPKLYAENGFRAVARLPFNDEYAPPDWDYERYGLYNNGRPDVVFMVHDPEHAAAYKPGDGERIATYDAGVAAQTAALEKLARSKAWAAVRMQAEKTLTREPNHMNALVEPFRARAEARRDREPPPLPGGNLFLRLLTARAIASATRRPALDVAGNLWPSDKVLAQLLTRSVSAPAMTTVAGWAAELAHKVVYDGLEGMGPSAAGARLLMQSLVLMFDGNGLISAPGFVAGAANAGFVAEGAPIPVRQLAATAALMQPYKLGAIGVLSREMIESSNAEVLVGDTLMRAASAALDVALFGSAAATAAQPAGLRSGVATTPPSASPDAFQAFFEDCATLINAVSVVGGNGPFVLIGSPGRIAAMVMRFVLQAGNVAVLASNAMGNDLMCVAPLALVAAISPQPEIEASTAAELHMNDTPLPIVNGGAPASPARSLFQTDSVALKMRWPLSWAIRDPRAVAWTTPSWK